MDEDTLPKHTSTARYPNLPNNAGHLKLLNF
jgi:hypothetical protein